MHHQLTNFEQNISSQISKLRLKLSLSSIVLMQCVAVKEVDCDTDAVSLTTGAGYFICVGHIGNDLP